MIRSESIKELATALSLAQSKMRYAPKSSENPFYRSKYADLSSVWDVARGPLTENGLSIVQIPTTSPEGKVCLETILLHNSGEFISGELILKPVREKKGEGFIPAEDPQALGSAISYARRYGLSAMCGVVTDEDDDGNRASGKSTPKTVAAESSTHPPVETAAEGAEVAGPTPPPSPPSEEDEGALRDYLWGLCEQIGKLQADVKSQSSNRIEDPTPPDAVLYQLTVNSAGKFGKHKTSEIFLKAKKKDGDWWSPLKATISKAEDTAKKLTEMLEDVPV